MKLRVILRRSSAGGLVFQPLSQPLLEHFYGRHVASKAPPSLLAEASEFRTTPDESIVVLSQVRFPEVASLLF